MISTLVLLSVIMPDCEGFLEENPKAFASSENLFNSTNGIIQVLHGVYEAGRQLYRGRYYVMMFGITSDEIYYRNTNSSSIYMYLFIMFLYSSI